MNSIYSTAAAATQNYVSGANNQTKAQSQWRRNHSQQRGDPTESSPAQPRTRRKSPHPQLRGISQSIRAIINDRHFKPARKNDSVKEIADKLQVIINKIRDETEHYDITTAEVWPDIWNTVGKFMSLELPEEHRRQAIREVFPILSSTVHIEPLDLKGWLSSDWAPQIAERIWLDHNQPHQTPSPLTAPQHNIETIKVRKDDSIETFREKTKSLSNALRSNKYPNDISRTQHIKDLVQFFLSEDQRWIQDLRKIILLNTGEIGIPWDKSTRIITPDEIEQWLISMWELKTEKHGKMEYKHHPKINRVTEIQRNDSHEEVRGKIHNMLHHIEKETGGSIISDDIDGRHKDDIITGLRSILSVDDSWMLQLQAIAANATHTPNALQPGSQLPLSYQGIQDWAATMWTNKPGSTLLRRMSNLMSSFQQKPPTDITMQYHEATTRIRDTVGKVEIILPVKRRNSQETELASVDISLLLTNLRLAGNWNDQSNEFWNEIEAKKLGQVLFQEDEANIPKNGFDGAPAQTSEVAGAIIEIARVQRHLEEGPNARINKGNTAETEPDYPGPDDTQIQRVKGIIYDRAFQEEDAAFRPSTQQASILIERNQKVLQRDEARGECGRTHCTNRSKCFRDRYRKQKYTNTLYLLLSCLKPVVTNNTTNDRQGKENTAQGPKVPMPTGSKKTTANTASHPQPRTAAKHDTTPPANAVLQQTAQDNTTEPAETKKQPRRRRQRAPQSKVCTTSIEPANQETTTDELTHWLQELEKEDWWPKDQTTKETPAPSEDTVTINMLSFGKPRRSQRVKKGKASETG